MKYSYRLHRQEERRDGNGESGREEIKSLELHDVPGTYLATAFDALTFEVCTSGSSREPEQVDDRRELVQTSPHCAQICCSWPCRANPPTIGPHVGGSSPRQHYS